MNGIEGDFPYGEKFAKIYDRLMEPNFYYSMKLYLKEIFSRYSLHPQNILELACGTGTFSFHFAGEGYSVTGLDISKHMLEKASERMSEEGVYVRFLEGDMRDLNLEEEFALVICFYDSLNYILEKEELFEIFRRVKRHLMPDGSFIFDMNTIYGLKEYWNSNIRIREFEGGRSIWKTDWVDEEKVNVLRISASFKDEDGNFQRIKEVHKEKGYPNELVRAYLEKVGFKEVDIYKCFSFQKDDGQAGKIVIVAR